MRFMTLGIVPKRKRGRPRVHHDDILDEVRRLDGTSMTRTAICKRLGISYPTIYRRIGPREKIVLDR